jgi:leucyl aminopeptidase (aminopeptidase T)
MTDKDRAYRTVLVDCLGVTEGENVLVLTDPLRRTIGDDLVAMARELGAEAFLVEMAERENHGTEPPDAVAAAMLACDVFIAPTTKSVSHTEARHAANAKGVRAATMPQITEDMLLRTMSADYEAVRSRSAALADRLTKGRTVHITTEAGTDVTFSIEGREGLSDDGDLRKPGAFGNLPAGEGFIAPVEGKTQGRIVFDGSIWPIELLDEPVIADIKDGYATLSGRDAARLDEIFGKYGREAYAVAELGIGTNEAAKLTGNTLEDEKILGTIHVAFGDNHSFGGTIRVASHQDGIVLDPTVTIDDEVVLEGGRLLVG